MAKRNHWKGPLFPNKIFGPLLRSLKLLMTNGMRMEPRIVKTICRKGKLAFFKPFFKPIGSTYPSHVRYVLIENCTDSTLRESKFTQQKNVLYQIHGMSHSFLDNSQEDCFFISLLQLVCGRILALWLRKQFFFTREVLQYIFDIGRI